MVAKVIATRYFHSYTHVECLHVQYTDLHTHTHIIQCIRCIIKAATCPSHAACTEQHALHILEVSPGWSRPVEVDFVVS